MPTAGMTYSSAQVPAEVGTARPAVGVEDFFFDDEDEDEDGAHDRLVDSRICGQCFSPFPLLRKVLCARARGGR